MTQSTTVVNGCDIVIQIDEEAGTLLDISGSSNELAMVFALNSELWRSFGSRYPGRLNCGKDMTGTLKIVYSPTVSEARELVEEWYHTSNGAARSFQFDLPDSSVGSLRYSGEIIMDGGYNIENIVAGEAKPIEITFNFAASGEITLDTIAS